MKLEGLSDRFSRTSLTEVDISLYLSQSVFISTLSTQVFGNLGMAEVHGPKLPSLGKPDLAKLTGQMSSCLALAQFRGQGAGQGAGPGAGPGKETGAAKMRRSRGSGWCGCLTGAGSEPPEITYCVADGGGGGLSLQALTPTTPMPEEEELNEKFAELVVSIFRITILIMCMWANGQKV